MWWRIPLDLVPHISYSEDNNRTALNGQLIPIVSFLDCESICDVSGGKDALLVLESITCLLLNSACQIVPEAVRPRLPLTFLVLLIIDSLQKQATLTSYISVEHGGDQNKKNSSYSPIESYLHSNLVFNNVSGLVLLWTWIPFSIYPSQIHPHLLRSSSYHSKVEGWVRKRLWILWNLMQPRWQRQQKCTFKLLELPGDYSKLFNRCVRTIQ